MNESEALSQFVIKPVQSTPMSESEAIAQFITVQDKDKCGVCGRQIIRKTNDVYPGVYFQAPSDGPQIEVCERCFDNDIKSRMF